MSGKFIFLIIIVAFLSFGCVSAIDADCTNQTELTAEDCCILDVDDSSDDVLQSSQSDVISSGNSSGDEVLSSSNNGQSDVFSLGNNSSADVLSISHEDKLSVSSNSKNSTFISLKANKIKPTGSLEVYLKDGDGNGLKNKKVTIFFNSKKYVVSTNRLGIASVKLNYVASKSYKVTASFLGDDEFDKSSKSTHVFVTKLNTKFNFFTNYVVSGNKLNIYLVNENNKALSGKKVILRLYGKNYPMVTDKSGRASLRITLKPNQYAFNARFPGDACHKYISKNFGFYVTKDMSIDIGNSKLLTGGFLRIYLKGSDVSKKAMQIKVGNKNFAKQTNFEGWLVIKPNMKEGKYWITVRCGKYQTSKMINCIKGNVKAPLYYKIPLVNGKPDLDEMPKDYVFGDGGATYTLTKSQYLDTMKRDSYCLFLYNKLTKYVFFKTKQYPKINHVLVREKWNVIEKEINRKLVSANQYGYWPSEVKVSLKGKSYTYPEVRDPQDTEYTCGPTSCSVCSQVLKSYYCESYLARLSGSVPVDGTSCSGMVDALEQLNFKCTYFYRDSFQTAIDELKKGGCAVVFHTKNHYVTLLDVSSDGKRVLVSNSYGDFYDIPSEWLSCEYMKTRYYKNYDDGLIVRLNYQLSDSVKKQIGCYYATMGSNWAVHNTGEVVS